MLFILVVVAGGGYGGWHGFLCVCWVIYVVIVFVVDMFIPEFYVHRLIVSSFSPFFTTLHSQSSILLVNHIIIISQDAVIAIIYAVLFAIATLVSIILAALAVPSEAKGVLGAAVVSPF